MPEPDISEIQKESQLKNAKKKFLNGWTIEQEKLLAEWADIAMSYRWLHDHAEKHYKRLNYFITIPVIVLSTLTGTASVGLSSVVGDNLIAQKYAQLGIGGVSIITGILSTLGNYLRFAQLEESNKNAAMSWSKFHRMIRTELALHPDRRQDCQDFLKHCRNDLDRLIENAPEIHKIAIEEFHRKIGSIKDFKIPDVIDNLDKTEIYTNDNLRLKQLALETALVINSKKELMRDLEFTDSDIRLYERIENRLKTIREEEYGDIGKLDLSISQGNSTTKPSSPVVEVNDELLERQLTSHILKKLPQNKSSNKISVKVDNLPADSIITSSSFQDTSGEKFSIKPTKNQVVSGNKL